MLARIRQWRHQVKRSLSIFRPEEPAASAEPEPTPPPAVAPRKQPIREAIAWEFLKGDGLEIGALQMLMAIRNRYATPFDIYALFYNQPASESVVVLSKT